MPTIPMKRSTHISKTPSNKQNVKAVMNTSERKRIEEKVFNTVMETISMHAEHKRIHGITSACKAVGWDPLEHLTSGESLESINMRVIDQLLEQGPSPSSAAYRTEYEAAVAEGVAMSATVDEYIASRCITDGIECPETNG